MTVQFGNGPLLDLSQSRIKMMYTCDDTNGLQAGIPLDGTLRTINMQEDPNGNIAALRIHQPDRPVLITEYWTGWFDWWGDKHHDLGPEFKSYWSKENLAKSNF